ncbi:hypothetical protein H4N58_08380 [Mumia sp. ZJ1417]|uniref:hypothetical protein n=1 Tax=Mumia sp. ZJ1417 TaxID=2708082 RepID=UPI001423048B|nr:hypothetical protein [Mumia sp. ZJ1417]QMW67855.1 hypothetical protein H4N58_08380 [Mumia sp. ZJ1417]
MSLDLDTRRALRRRAVVVPILMILAVGLLALYVVSPLDTGVYTLAFVGLLALTGTARTVGPEVPLQALRPLLHARGAATAVVLPNDPRPWESRRTLRLRIGTDDYQWDARLPKGCVPYPGGTLDLRGDVRDGGWVLALDPAHGTAYPCKRLRLRASPAAAARGD